jgi:hypothetical protein
VADIKLLVGTTNLVRLAKFKDVDAGTYPEDATVTCDVLTVAGAAVNNASAIAMAKKAATSGAATVYQGTIPANWAGVVGTKYKIRVTAISGASQRQFYLSAVGAEG